MHNLVHLNLWFMTIQYLENAVPSNRWSLIRSLKIFFSEKKMNCGGMDSGLNEKKKEM